MLRTVAAFVLAAGLACAVAPASQPTNVIPAGVSVAGVRVGSLSAEPARARIEAAFNRPMTIAFHGTPTSVSAAALGAKLNVDAAVSSALVATPRSRIELPVRYSSARVAKLVDSLARRYDRLAVDAKVIGATSAGPIFSPARSGIAVRVPMMRAAIAQLLRSSDRETLVLLTRPVRPKRTPANFAQ
jgi:hypothetical protein